MTESRDYNNIEFKTKGLLSRTTFKKRRSSLINMCSWITSSGFNLNDFINSVMEKNLKKLKDKETKKFFFDINCQKLLRDINLVNENEKFVRDMFLLSCQTGMRISDILSCSEREIFKSEYCYEIRKFSEKTGLKFKVPISITILDG